MNTFTKKSTRKETIVFSHSLLDESFFAGDMLTEKENNVEFCTAQAISPHGLSRPAAISAQSRMT